MWSAEEFTSLVETETDTFGGLLGHHCHGLVQYVGEGARVSGFLVYVARDPLTQEYVMWTLLVLVEDVLMRLRADPWEWLCGWHSHPVGDYGSAEVKCDQPQRRANEDERVRRLRGCEARLMSQGERLIISGSEWGGWCHTTTELAIAGAQGFFGHIADVLAKRE